MRVRLFTVASLLSILVCLGVAALWVRSYGPDASAAPSTARAQAVLARRLPGVIFNGVGLSDVVDFLADMTGADMVVDWRALERAGIERDTPVSARLTNARTGEAIQLLAAGRHLVFSIDGNIVFIGLPGDGQRGLVTERPGHGSAATDAALRKRPGMRLPLGGTWAQVLARAGAAAQVPIRLDRDALASAGIPLDQPVGLSSYSGWRNDSTADALKLLLRNARPTQDVQFQLRGDSVLISSRHKLDEEARRWGVVVWTGCALAALLVLIMAIVWRRAAPSPRVQVVGVAVLFTSAATLVIAWAQGPPLRENQTANQLWSLTNHHGILRLWHGPADPAEAYQGSGRIGGATAPDAERVVRFAGIAVSRGGSPFNTWVVAVPCWMLLGLALILPALWLAALLRRLRRRNLNLCARCGYDLRHSPDRCPECGTPVAQVSAS